MKFLWLRKSVGLAGYVPVKYYFMVKMAKRKHLKLFNLDRFITVGSSILPITTSIQAVTSDSGR